jgi:glycosyltransferase involved in cell wall biosynthesis
MKVLFLDQSGPLGGAELFLLDIARSYRDSCLVGLFADGSFKEALEQQGTDVCVLSSQAIQVRKDSNLMQASRSIGQLVPLILKVAQLSHQYELIYANTQKALVVGALASLLSRRPLVYHLHDILSPEHFSTNNLYLAVTLANRFASRVFATSVAAKNAFIAAGGRSHLVEVVYNGFEISRYQNLAARSGEIRQQLNLGDAFVVGHFSRLSPWKGQHILIEALIDCPENVMAVFVGDALFGEQDYIKSLHEQVAQLELEDRVRFLGFRSEVPQLMAACDLVTHTSIAPEPFGRVIAEAMLCGVPVIAAKAGGAVELIEEGRTGWLFPSGDAKQLATVIQQCQSQPAQIAAIAQCAQAEASQRFNITTISELIDQLLHQI